MPNPIRENREQEEVRREIDRSARLRDRVHAQLTDVGSGTALYRRFPELGTPDVFAVVQGQFVQTNVTIRNEKIDILPIKGRAVLLEEFARELEAGFRRMGEEYHLEYGAGPGTPPIAGPVGDGRGTNFPIGWHAYYRRPVDRS